MHGTLLALSIENVLVSGIEQNIEAVATTEVRPVGILDSFFALHAAYADPVAVILQASTDAVERLCIINRDTVVFAGREVSQVVPVLTRGITLINTTVAP